MSNNDIRNEIREVFYSKEHALKSTKTLHVAPLAMTENVKALRRARDYNDAKEAILKFISTGKELKIPIDRLFEIIISNVSCIEPDKLADICVDAEMGYRETTSTNKPTDPMGNQLTTDGIKDVIEQPIAAKNMGFDPSALIRQPQPQQPNMVMGQMYNPSFSIAQNANTVHANTSHGPNCQCPSCKGSPYWDGMSIQDKAAFVSQHYDILDIHKKNVTEDELNALINLIKNPHTHHSITRLGYTGDISSLKLKEVPPVKYNEYGKGIVNRYFEVPVGNNNIVICYNTHGSPDSNGYMTYNTIIKLDKDLQSNQ